jgi:hypothetical protein
VIAGLCDGKSECEYWKGSDPRDVTPTKQQCRSVHYVDYQCHDEPVRSLRQEGQESFRGSIKIDCNSSAFLQADSMPYGIQVIHATYGANQHAKFGNTTIPVQALCDGRLECTFTIEVTQIGDPAVGQAKTFELAYRCGKELSSRWITLPAGAGNGDRAYLDCRSSLKPVANAIAVDWATYGANCGASFGNAGYLARSLCDGRESCDVAALVPLLRDPAPGCEKSLDLQYRCGQRGIARSYQALSAPLAGLTSEAPLICPARANSG